MRNDWILDVLRDLRSFAGQNGMLALSAQLDETLLVASAEIAMATASGAGGEGNTARNTH